MVYGYWVVWSKQVDEYTDVEIKYCKDESSLLDFVNQDKFLNDTSELIENTKILKVIRGESINLIEKDVKTVGKYEIG